MFSRNSTIWCFCYTRTGIIPGTGTAALLIRCRTASKLHAPLLRLRLARKAQAIPQCSKFPPIFRPRYNTNLPKLLTHSPTNLPTRVRADLSNFPNNLPTRYLFIHQLANTFTKIYHPFCHQFANFPTNLRTWYLSKHQFANFRTNVPMGT
ncbi:unnamed protein product, partial [Laminaria digitata]